jgi:hypothetical protein
MVEAALRAVRPDAPRGEPPISSTKWGVYAFYDYEDEPIYVGQTNESLRVRIRRHLTNQRTDAVGMRVLDPYEIRWIEMWPLVEFSSGQKNPLRGTYQPWLPAHWNPTRMTRMTRMTRTQRTPRMPRMPTRTDH